VHGRHIHKCFGREDVPEVQRHDVGDQEVDFIGAVGDLLPGLGADVVSAAAGGAYAMGGLEILRLRSGFRLRAQTPAERLNLHFQQASAGVDDEVVALAVSPSLGDSDTHGGGLDQEGGFG
jgi:hypothetical protein